jgi:hypothetical protein
MRYNFRMGKKKREKLTPEELEEYAVLKAVADDGEDGFDVPEGSEEEVMEWLDCGWKRIPCGKRSCPLCGRMARDRERLEREGIDPDSLEGGLNSVGAELAEALIMIKKDADAMGIDITNIEEVEETPDSEEFPLVVEAQQLYTDVLQLYEEASKKKSPWLLTESAADILWYSGILHAKLYRQFCNRWHIDNEHAYGDFDHKYTAGVLRQVTLTLARAFDELDFVGELKPFRDRFEAVVGRVQAEKGLA